MEIFEVEEETPKKGGIFRNVDSERRDCLDADSRELVKLEVRESLNLKEDSSAKLEIWTAIEMESLNLIVGSSEKLREWRVMDVVNLDLNVDCEKLEKKREMECLNMGFDQKVAIHLWEWMNIMELGSVD